MKERTPSPPIGEPDSVERMLRQAAFLIDVGRPEEAIPLLHQALARSPEDSQILHHLSIAYLQLGDSSEALEFASQAVAAEPDDAEGHRLRSLALHAMGKRAPALKAAREAVRLAPEQPDCLVMLVQALVESRRLKEAETTAERLRTIAPEGSDTWAALGLVSLGRKRWKEAEERCRRALTLNPESFQAMNNLGVALLGQKKKRREAVELFERTAALDPSEELGRKNLKTGVNKYIGTAGIVFVLLSQAGGYTLDQKGGEVFGIALITFAVVGFFAVRWLRFRTLPEHVKGYIRAERRQTIPRLILKTVAWSVGGFFLLLLLLALIGGLADMAKKKREAPPQPAPSGPVRKSS